MYLVGCKGGLGDVGALQRQVGWYEEEIVTAARRLGSAMPRNLVVVALLLATRRNLETVRANRELLRTTFPNPVCALRSLLASESPPKDQLRVLAMVDPRRRGPGWLISTPLERGRPIAPYADARAFLEGRRERQTPP